MIIKIQNLNLNGELECEAKDIEEARKVMEKLYRTLFDTMKKAGCTWVGIDKREWTILTK